MLGYFDCVRLCRVDYWVSVALMFQNQKSRYTTDIHVQGILVAIAYILIADMATQNTEISTLVNL